MLLKKQEIENKLNHYDKSSSAADSANSIQQRHNRSIKGLTSEREKEALIKKDQISVDKLSNFNKLFEMMSFLSPNINIVDNRIQPYVVDIYPAECNIEKCKERLNYMYETTKSYKLHYEYLKIEKNQPEMMDLLKRLGNNSPETLDWYFKSKVGDIFKNYSYKPYDSRILHSYSNEAVQSELLTPGTSHVSVGFTDLGMFHTVGFAEECTQNKPLSWIGYEASSYCVAKTAIIVAMIEIGASADEIMQVWYSAAWSCETLKLFRAAINYLLESEETFCLIILTLGFI